MNFWYFVMRRVIDDSLEYFFILWERRKKKWRNLIGREKSILISAIKNASIFHAIRMQIRINCLFCYCPLYALGDKCGGNFRYTENGIKDCTNCMLPHKRKSYGYITGKYQELSTLMKKIRENEQTETKIPRGIK